MLHASARCYRVWLSQGLGITPEPLSARVCAHRSADDRRRVPGSRDARKSWMGVLAWCTVCALCVASCFTDRLTQFTREHIDLIGVRRSGELEPAEFVGISGWYCRRRWYWLRVDALHDLGDREIRPVAWEILVDLREPCRCHRGADVCDVRADSDVLRLFAEYLGREWFVDHMVCFG